MKTSHGWWVRSFEKKNSKLRSIIKIEAIYIWTLTDLWYISSVIEKRRKIIFYLFFLRFEKRNGWTSRFCLSEIWIISLTRCRSNFTRIFAMKRRPFERFWWCSRRTNTELKWGWFSSLTIWKLKVFFDILTRKNEQNHRQIFWESLFYRNESKVWVTISLSTIEFDRSTSTRTDLFEQRHNKTDIMFHDSWDEFSSVFDAEKLVHIFWFI